MLSCVTLFCDVNPGACTPPPPCEKVPKLEAPPPDEAPPVEYDQRYHTDLIRILRLYFNQLDSLTPNQAQSYRADNFYGGDFVGYGQNLVFPHIAASDSTDQIASGNNTSNRVRF